MNDRQPIPVTEIVAALERESANADTDPRWMAAQCLRHIAGWESRTLICRVDQRGPETVAREPNGGILKPAEQASEPKSIWIIRHSVTGMPYALDRPLRGAAEYRLANESLDDFVTIPKNEAQAEMMVKLGYAWLQASAPHLLRAGALPSSYAVTEHQKIQDFAILHKLHRGQPSSKSHADIVLDLARAALCKQVETHRAAHEADVARRARILDEATATGNVEHYTAVQMNVNGAAAPFSEAHMTINGRALSVAESMTMRVALENFAFDLSTDGLGDDAHAKRMVKGYNAAIEEIRRKIGY